MPPRKKREAQVLATALKKLGITVEGNQDVGNLLKSASAYSESDNLLSASEKLEIVKRDLEMAAERTSLEAESVLFYIEVRGKGFHEKMCKECGLPFASTYRAVSYCSDVCRHKSLAKVGILWNIYGKTDAGRWDGRIPKTLSPEAYIAAIEAVENMPEETVLEEVAIEEVLNKEQEEIDIQMQEILKEED